MFLTGLVCLKELMLAYMSVFPSGWAAESGLVYRWVYT
jgi:hypothetical protein